MEMIPGGAKSKGANGERELARLLSQMAKGAGYDLTFERNLEQTRGGGHDLNCVEANINLAIEVKRVESDGPATQRKHWEQALRQAETAEAIPVLASRRNRRPWMFKVQLWSVHYPLNMDAAQATVQPLHAKLDQSQFELWFQAHIRKLLL